MRLISYRFLDTAEAARLKAEAEAKAKADEEAKVNAEAEAKRKAEGKQFLNDVVVNPEA